MVKKILIVLVGIFLVYSADAQSWRKLKKDGDAAFEKGDFSSAADLFDKAWQKSGNKKKELIFKAGEAYYETRNYRKAAEAYQNVKDENDEYPLVGLKYARMLKQDGQYDKASKAFAEFRDGYTSSNKAILADIIATEIEGCELGKTLPAQANPGVEIVTAGSSINTSDNEFAPLSFSKDVLYFSSSMGGQARIYRATASNGAWGKGGTPENFPVIKNGQYCQGTLTPDGQRFYFTICDAKGSFDNRKTRCEIYVIKRQANNWNQPERLSDLINPKGVTATNPHVVQKGDSETLYFASNRTGGRGGLDLWYATRLISANNNDFSQPVNLGPVINSPGDEMSPFFDAAENRLFFASNGHPGIGGFDIFSSRGEQINWLPAENAGTPFNSSADDYYWAKNIVGEGGFLVSNRIFAGEKLSTKDDDIFEFRVKSRSAILEATVFGQDSEPLNNYVVTLYEIRNDGSEQLLVNRDFTTAKYNLELLANRQFRVEITAPNYETGSYNLFTDNPTPGQPFGQPMFLKSLLPPKAPPVTNNPVVTNPGVKSTPGKNNNPPNKINVPVNPQPTEAAGNYTSRGVGPTDKGEYSSTAPRYEGDYFKVQLVALSNYNPNDVRFAKLKDLGEIQLETITAQNLNRVLVATFFTAAEAKKAMNEAKKRGFVQSFIVKYQNGARYGRVNL